MLASGRWDDNDDGFISRKEFRKVLPAMGVPTERKAADALFDAMDPEREGRIDICHLEKAPSSSGRSTSSRRQQQ